MSARTCCAWSALWCTTSSTPGVRRSHEVGRSVEEALRTIQAFKTGALCPIDWKPGQATLKG